MSDNSFSSTVASLFKGMDSFITTKTVVGDAVHIGETIIECKKSGWYYKDFGYDTRFCKQIYIKRQK